MNRLWQLPISNQLAVRKRVHLLPSSRRRDQIVGALCGKKFNPGFATPEVQEENTLRCLSCLRLEALRVSA